MNKVCNFCEDSEFMFVVLFSWQFLLLFDRYLKVCYRTMDLKELLIH